MGGGKLRPVPGLRVYLCDHRLMGVYVRLGKEMEIVGAYLKNLEDLFVQE